MLTELGRAILRALYPSARVMWFELNIHYGPKEHTPYDLHVSSMFNLPLSRWIAGG
jgi:hypothetical protein